MFWQICICLSVRFISFECYYFHLPRDVRDDDACKRCECKISWPADPLIYSASMELYFTKSCESHRSNWANKPVIHCVFGQFFFWQWNRYAFFCSSFFSYLIHSWGLGYYVRSHIRSLRYLKCIFIYVFAKRYCNNYEELKKERRSQYERVYRVSCAKYLLQILDLEADFLVSWIRNKKIETVQKMGFFFVLSKFGACIQKPTCV